MEPNSTDWIMNLIARGWPLIVAFVGIGAFRGEVLTKIKAQKERIDRMEDRLDKNIETIQTDIKEILRAVGK